MSLAACVGSASVWLEGAELFVFMPVLCPQETHGDIECNTCSQLNFKELLI